MVLKQFMTRASFCMLTILLQGCTPGSATKRQIRIDSEQLKVERVNTLEGAYFELDKYQPEAYLQEASGVTDIYKFYWERLVHPLVVKHQIFLGYVPLTEGPTVLVIGRISDHSIFYVGRLGHDVSPCSDGSYALFNKLLVAQQWGRLDATALLQLSDLYLQIFSAPPRIDLTSKEKAPSYRVTHRGAEIRFSTSLASGHAPFCTWCFTYDKQNHLVKLVGSAECMEITQ